MSFILKIKVKAGNHHRNNCPVSLELNREKIPESETLRLEDETGRELSVDFIKKDDCYQLLWNVDKLDSGEEMIYTLSSKSGSGEKSGVELKEKPDKIDIKLDNKYFSSYVFDPDIAKPYLGPIIGPEGDSWTRIDFETEEHPHHRSLWVAIGDVEGVDFWNEPEGEYGKQKHQKFRELYAGSSLARISTDNVWTDFQDNPLVNESRKIDIFNIDSDNKIIDIEIKFKADYGKVEFGPTKEAGPLGVRMARPLKVDNGGTIYNSYGAINEEECWGKRAAWCDYYGVINDHRRGIAVFDNPENKNFPTYWHIRNYGLMAPNNFYFIGGRTLKPDETLKYKYRIFFHTGNSKKARVEKHYQNYINPPEIEVIN